MDSMRAQIERVCISVNTECNLACRYCYFFQQDTKKTTSDPLKIEEIVDILNRISQYSESENITKKLKVLFVGSGEPLLRWGKIRDAVRTVLKSKQSMIRFYLITNGTLLDNTIAKEMKELNIVPSISLDGYREIHDENRTDAKGEGTFDRVMKGIDVLRKNNMEIIINTSVTYSLIEHISEFFCFLKNERLDKVIFNRLADVPQSFRVPEEYEFHKFLLDAHRTKIEMGLTNIEIGNIESLTRSILGTSDKVCTMFGSSCGAGTKARSDPEQNWLMDWPRYSPNPRPQRYRRSPFLRTDRPLESEESGKWSVRYWGPRNRIGRHLRYRRNRQNRRGRASYCRKITVRGGLFVSLIRIIHPANPLIQSFQRTFADVFSR